MTTPFPYLRTTLRNCFFRILSRALAADDGKQAAVESLRGLLNERPQSLNCSTHAPTPYAGLGEAPSSNRTCLRIDPVFVTGRFRSGSTLLWNIFRHADGCTAYYEPFNERRWFDPTTRGERIDGTHRGVSDYWREYNGITGLGTLYEQSWIEKNLYMPAEFWNPRMKRYVETLIEQAAGRPVLQFNRIDFRLAWFRRSFPKAKIVHICRHPRDQWCSALMGSSFPTSDTPSLQFSGSDHLYLRMWCRDLKYHFPFLDESRVRHPYQLFYYVWKLSYLHGVAYADCFVQFESLVQQPLDTLQKLLSAINQDCANLDELLRLVESPRLARWHEYASEEWFKQHESECEQVLQDFFATSVELEPNA